MWHRDTKWANAIGNCPNILAWCRDARNLQFAKNAVSAKCNDVKCNKMRYACIGLQIHRVQSMTYFKLGNEWGKHEIIVLYYLVYLEK